MPLKILVDYELCEANRVCVRQAPEVFQVDESDQLYVLQEHPSDSQIPDVKTAARRCPRQAIKLVEE